MSTSNAPNVQLHTPGDDRSHDPNWNDPPERLSRSPRPYRRKRDYPNTSAAPSRRSSYASNIALTPAQSDVDLSGHVPGFSRPPSRLDLATPGESGAEGDDEGFSFVKALPPPPEQSRKGLRSTPEQNDEVTQATSKVGIKATARPADPDGHITIPSETPTPAEAARRGRSLQRAFETLCLGLLVCTTANVSDVLGLNSASMQQKRTTIWLSSYTLILALIVGSLLIGRYGRYLNSPGKRTDVLGKIDPAPVLYPTMVPVLVSVSMCSDREDMLLINMVLGLSTIPRRLVSSTFPSGYNSVHWALTMVPVVTLPLIFRLLSASEWALADTVKMWQLSYLDLSLLFPFHQALISPIRYLTTSSLLSSEQQLLSVALINLLVLSASPPMAILKYVLWIGGFGVFYLCKYVLKWNVALERIPSWRFKRAGAVIRASRTFMSTLAEGLKSQSSQRNMPGGNSADTKSLQDGVIQENVQQRARHGSRLEPNSPTQLADGESARGKLHKRKMSSTMQSYLNMTPAQVNVRKWLYAVYTYIVAFGLVLGPIRLLIQHQALQGAEPFCWAVGYLFSDIPYLRYYIGLSPVNAYVPMPPYAMSDSSPSSTWEELLHEFLHYSCPMTRLYLLAYWAVIVAIGVITVLTLSDRVNVDTRRKVFHFTMVALLLPTAYIDPAYLSLGLVLVLVVFLFLELLRAAQLRPLSKPLARFLSPYVDGRDLRGPIVISHIFLLIGSAIPFWLSLAALPIADAPAPWRGWSYVARDVSMLSGVICVGMGDAAASLVGRAIGRHKWPWPGGKSLEGSGAFAVAVTVGLLLGKALLIWGGWRDVHPMPSNEIRDWLVVASKAGIAACGASMTEAVLTGCNDNVVVPIVLWLWVRGLKL